MGPWTLATAASASRPGPVWRGAAAVVRPCACDAAPPSCARSTGPYSRRGPAYETKRSAPFIVGSTFLLGSAVFLTVTPLTGVVTHLFRARPLKCLCVRLQSFEKMLRNWKRTTHVDRPRHWLASSHAVCQLGRSPFIAFLIECSSFVFDWTSLLCA